MLGKRRSEPLAPLGFGNFAVVDVETSGFSRHTDRVLSVAVTTLAPDGGVVEEFSTLLDPGCDPGPVHIHGLTREVLAGAPRFDSVQERLSGLLSGRVLVAHNASFDHGFLTGEFERVGGVLPVDRRLCTLALARRLSLPTADCRLGTLAAHYKVQQTRAHTASDDVRVLTGVLRGLMSDASRLGVPLPFLSCPPGGGVSRPGAVGGGRAAAAKRAPAAARAAVAPQPGGPLAGRRVLVLGGTPEDAARWRTRIGELGGAPAVNLSASVTDVLALPGAEDSVRLARARELGLPIRQDLAVAD